MVLLLEGTVTGSEVFRCAVGDHSADQVMWSFIEDWFSRTAEGSLRPIDRASSSLEFMDTDCGGVKKTVFVVGCL